MDDEQANPIFFPHAYHKAELVRKKRKRFVHYTSIDALHSILSSRRFWMRDATTMNDYSEIRHGEEQFFQLLHGDIWKKLLHALTEVHAGLGKEVDDYLRENFRIMISDVYIACFSEHEEGEDRFGRLSMWRAYGKQAGAAIIFKHEVFFRNNGSLGVTFSPVNYSDKDEMEKELIEIITGIEREVELLRNIKRERLADLVLVAIRTMIVCTKHRGFKEEKEWRLIYFPRTDGAKHLKEKIVPIDGGLQIIFEIPLEENNKIGLDLSPDQIFDKIIIGPSKYPMSSLKSILLLLNKSGVTNAGERVLLSNIPLRT